MQWSLVTVLLLVQCHGRSMLQRIQLVGHSLGAHLLGFLAKQVQELGLGRVARITGLDPALPLFNVRVSKTSSLVIYCCPVLSGPGGGLTSQTRTSCRLSTATPGASAWR